MSNPSSLPPKGRKPKVAFLCVHNACRSLLPKGVENLLLAGRNICGTHIAHSSFRVMPICLGTGEAAGTPGRWPGP